MRNRTCRCHKDRCQGPWSPRSKPLVPRHPNITFGSIKTRIETHPNIRLIVNASTKTRVRLFTSKQEIVILLTNLELYTLPVPTNPTIKQIQHGLKVFFGHTLSTRQIRRLVAELESEGVLKRTVRAWNHAAAKRQEQTSKYTILNFEKAFYNILELKDLARKYKRMIYRRKRASCR